MGSRLFRVGFVAGIVFFGSHAALALPRFALPDWKAFDGRRFGDFTLGVTTVAEMKRRHEYRRRDFLPENCWDVLTHKDTRASAYFSFAASNEAALLESVLVEFHGNFLRRPGMQELAGACGDDTEEWYPRRRVADRRLRVWKSRGMALLYEHTDGGYDEALALWFFAPKAMDAMRGHFSRAASPVEAIIDRMANEPLVAPFRHVRLGSRLDKELDNTLDRDAVESAVDDGVDAALRRTGHMFQSRRNDNGTLSVTACITRHEKHKRLHVSAEGQLSAVGTYGWLSLSANSGTKELDLNASNRQLCRAIREAAEDVVWSLNGQALAAMQREREDIPHRARREDWTRMRTLVLAR